MLVGALRALWRLLNPVTYSSRVVLLQVLPSTAHYSRTDEEEASLAPGCKQSPQAGRTEHKSEEERTTSEKPQKHLSTIGKL